MFCYQTAAYRRNEGLELADHVRQPGRHAARRCRSGSRSRSRPARPSCSPTACSAGWALPAWASRTGFRLLDPVKSAAQPDRVHPAAPRPRGAAAARGPAAVPRGRRLGGLAGTGDGRLPAPVHRAQPDARGRLRDRGPAASRWPTSSARSCRVVGTVDEIAPAAGRAGDPPGRAARRRVRAGAAGRPLRARRRLDVEHDHVADRGRLGALARRARASCRTRSTEVPDDAAARARCPRSATASATDSSWPARSAPGSRARSLGTAPADGPRRARADVARRPASCRGWPGSSRSSRARGSRSGCWSRSARAGRPTTSSSCSRIAPTTPARSTSGSTTSCAGLISIGVRQGEHVGVLMGTRPSALALVAALSRLGAVSVLLRPDGDTAREAALGAGRSGSSPTPSGRRSPPGSARCTRSCSAAAAARATSACR